MQEAAASRIGELVSRWHQVHPNFERDGGQIVLMGHSLGSLICFDLLSKERAAADSSADGPSLSTDVSACVALGSPVGCFLALRGQRPGPDFVLPRCPRYFNLYHRSDVVAYRLEPLLTAAAQPPAFVPFARGRDGQRLHVRLQQTIRDVQRKTNALSAWVSARVESAAATFDRRQAQERAAAAQAEEAASPMSSRSAEASVGAVRIALNAGERVDWIIQESELEAANEYLSATQAHQGYFVNEDVAAFVLNQVVGKGEAVGD
jgi:pimeloyl-ACP methyl ester carboxylesterase